MRDIGLTAQGMSDLLYRFEAEAYCVWSGDWEPDRPRWVHIGASFLFVVIHSSKDKTYSIRRYPTDEAFRDEVLK